MDSEDKGVHDGHRARMRAKFAEHGPRIFDTYELVEMLLYHAVPMRDTNPIAKRLLATFGGLAGLLRSEREELLKVPGIGEKTADLIRLVGRADIVGRLSADVKPRVIFDDYHATGRFVQKYISETGATAAIFLLDDSMHLLGAVNVETTRFGSGATRPKPFVDAVVRYSASYSVIGFTNGNGLARPFSSDIVTCDMLAKEMRYACRVLHCRRRKLCFCRTETYSQEFLYTRGKALRPLKIYRAGSPRLRDCESHGA